MVNEYGWGEFSCHNVLVGLGLFLFKQVFWHIIGYHCVAIEVRLAELAGTLVAGTLGGA